MKFSDPYLLNLLWLFVLAFGIVTYGMHQRKKIVTAFARHSVLGKVMPGYSPERRWAKACLILFAQVFCIICLAGPLAGFRWEKIEQKGVDIMIALDCSKSMLAKDIKPDRLSRAKHEIIDLLRMMKQDRAGLVAFSGKAILQCPLTLDHEAFHIFLNVLEPGYLPMGGTNLEDAVQTAFSGFEKESDTDKAIILITDGENTGGDVEEAAKQMAQKGVKIFTIGVGDAAGAPIPDENGGFKKDGQGRIVMSKVDEAVLQKIAAVTGGAYVRSVAGDMDLDLIYKERIRGTMEKKTVSSGRKKVWENRFQWFLLPCVILLLIEFVIPSSRKAKGVTATVFAAMVVFGVLTAGTGVAHAGVASDVKKGITAFDEGRWEDAKKHFIDAQLQDPDNEKIYYNIGAAAYMNAQFDLAQGHFLQAAQTDDPKLKQKAMYNLANTYYRLGQLEDAVETYERLLDQFPEDEQARENLAFVKQKMEEQQQQQQQQQQDQQQQQQQQDQQDQQDRQDRQQDQQEQQEQENQKNSADRQNSENQNRKDGSQKGDTPSPNEGQGQQNKPGDPPEPPAGKSPDGQQTAASPGPEQQQAPDPDDGAAAGQLSHNALPSADGRGTLEHKLNRLEDKPGRALMPATAGPVTDKDW